MDAYAAEVARWTLVLVIAAAALSKMVQGDRLAGLAATLRRGLRLPAAHAVAWTLLAAEAAVTALLVVPWTRTAGLLGAAGLMAALATGTVVLARRDDPLPCRCFGASDSVVTWGTVVRNVVLAMLAAGAAAWYVTGPEPAPSLATSVAAASTAVVGVVAGRWLGVRWLQARRARRHPHSQAVGEPATLPPNGPDVGKPAPAVPGFVADGPPRMVAFLSTHCRGCRQALPQLVEYARVCGDRDRVVVAIVGPTADGADIADAVSGVSQVLHDAAADELATAYAVVLFPTYVLVTDDGEVEATALSVRELPRPVS